LTKEPKLDRARRQVPEWEKYDNEVADFQKRLKKRKTTATESNASESTDKSNLIQDQKIEYIVEQEDIIDVLDDMGQKLPGSQQEAAVRDEL
jgi:UDP-glucose:glycoprotein glucosyltransferase